MNKKQLIKYKVLRLTFHHSRLSCLDIYQLKNCYRLCGCNEVYSTNKKSKFAMAGIYCL